MSNGNGLRFGIVGIGGRGSAFVKPLRALGADIVAACDVDGDRMKARADEYGISQTYTDLGRMLESSSLDAVIVASPMQFHVEQTVAALNRGVHVLCEVPAAVSVEECRTLVDACRRSNAVYMMAENYVYTRPCMTVTELVRRGMFGETYYAEGEYLHELKDLNERTSWRRRWQTGIDGITYGTHSLGPILQWMPGDRVTRVACEGSGHHYADPRGEPYAQDTSVMLCKTAKGGLIKIRVDMLSDRPHAMTVLQLQGTDGAFESSRGGPDECDRLWLRALSKSPEWSRLDALTSDYIPERWRNAGHEVERAGHGGGDHFVIEDFVKAALGEIACPIGVHEAMDMTLPGLISQQSVREEGRWMSVPDSRLWPDETPRPQLQMVWPQGQEPSPVPAPSGYSVRQYTNSDEADYIELLTSAGFDGWDSARVSQLTRQVLPGGFFVVECTRTGELAATAVAQHSPSDLHPHGGELGWVAASPQHRGRRLGRTVCSAALARLMDAGYEDIYLKTDDFRLPAIKTYLALGFQPLLFCEGMSERWQAVTDQVGWNS